MFLNISETLDNMESMIKERDELERKIAKAKRGPRDLGGIAMDGMPKRKANRPDAKNAMDMLQKDTLRVEEIKADLEFLSKKLRPLIERMPHHKRTAMAARYLDCMSVERAAIATYCNRTTLDRQLKKYKDDLLEELATEGDKTKPYPL